MYNSNYRVVDFRAQVTSIRDVIARRHLKVAFFGRTSCGKSSVINALLGENVLPMGLGHTTTKFVHVQGTDSENPYMEHENGERLDLDGESKLLPVDSIQSNSINLFWPRDKCNLLK